MLFVIASTLLSCSNGCPDGSTAHSDGTCVLDCDVGFTLTEEKACVPISESECGDNVSVSGSFAMAGHELGINENQETGLRFEIEHKIDIDDFEAGCIDDITLSIEQDGLGCKIDLDFRSNGDGSFRLADFMFSADSFCPNFPDSIEGIYSLIDDPFLMVEGLPSQIEMESGIEEEVCLPNLSLQFQAAGQLSLDGDNETQPFDLSLNLTGSSVSSGSTDANCVVGDEEDSGATCSGDFSIDGSDSSGNLALIESCKSINGNLTIVDTNMADFALQNLEHISGSLRISRNTALRNLDGLQALKTIGGNIDITANEELAEITGLLQLENVGGDVTIVNNPELCESAANGFISFLQGLGWNGEDTTEDNESC